ncbi:MAG: fluoride efflux transporter CrcB [Solirubrobacteraceae bacterium]
MSTWVWAAVAVLGGLGAVFRFVLEALIGDRTRREFPFGTLTVNTTGALLLGLLTGLAVSGDALLLEGTATLGSYTTFSTWMFETHRLAEDGNGSLAILNALLSVTVGVGAAALGRAIGAQA